MPGESTTVVVTLDYWDIYCANVALLFRMFRIGLLIDAILAIVFLALFLLGRIVVLPQSAYEIANDPMILILLWGLLASILVAPLFTARRAVRDERVQQGKTYTFSETGVHIEAPNATSDVQWATFRYVIATRYLILLLASKTAAGALILPIGSFANESDLATIRYLIDRKVPKTKFRLY
jgi:hypothetical protein